MAEIILPPEEEQEETPQEPELNIDKPTENSKVITIEFEAKKTNKVSAKDTNQQLYTTDTDAWFEFKETSLENANGTYSAVFRNRHDGSIFQRTGDVVNGVAYYKIPHQEIRHAGAWRGQIVYTLSNGDTTAREFGYDVKGHILDGKDVREIVVEDFETLMSQLRNMKDNAEQELANLVNTANQNETDRQVFFDGLVEDIDDLQANYQELLDTGVLQTSINTKLEALEEEYAPKLTEVTAQLAQKASKESLGEVNQDLQTTKENIANIITTPAEGISEQEIIEARKGKNSLGEKVETIDKGISKITEQAFKQYYRLGEEHEGVTGGYVEGYKRDGVITEGGTSKEVDHLKIALTTEGTDTAELTLITDNMVDLTDINTIFIDWEQLNSHHGIRSAFIVHHQKAATNGVYTERILKRDKFNRSVDSIDVSHLVGNYYLRIHSYTTAYNLNLDLRTYNIYASGSFKAEKNYVNEEIVKTKKQMLNYAYTDMDVSVDGKWTPEILERQLGSQLRVLFRFRSDSDRLAIRPTNALVNKAVLWPDIKSELEEHIISQDGVEYLAIPESQAFVYDFSEDRFRIVSRGNGMNENQLIILHNNLGIAVEGEALKWRYSKYKFDSDSIPDGLIQSNHLDSSIISSLGSSHVPENRREEFDDLVYRSINRAKKGSFRLLFVTDTHGKGSTLSTMVSNLNIASAYAENQKLDLLVHGGDVVNGYSENRREVAEYLNEAVKILSKNATPFVLRGNHDDNSYYDTSSPSASDIIYSQQWHNTVLKQLENEVVFDSDNLTGGYYYQDFQQQKIRVVALNSIDYPDDSEVFAGFNGWGYSQQQINWLANEALDFTDKEDWQLLVFTHAGTRQSVSNRYENENRLIPYNSPLVEGVIKAFKEGTSYTDSTNSSGTWSANVSMDYSEQGSREVIAIISGHVHADRLDVNSELGFPLVSTKHCQTSTDGAFDVITINPNEKEVFMDRFGDGEDRNFTY